MRENQNDSLESLMRIFKDGNFKLFREEIAKRAESVLPFFNSKFPTDDTVQRIIAAVRCGDAETSGGALSCAQSLSFETRKAVTPRNPVDMSALWSVYAATDAVRAAYAADIYQGLETAVEKELCIGEAEDATRDLFKAISEALDWQEP